MLILVAPIMAFLLPSLWSQGLVDQVSPMVTVQWKAVRTILGLTRVPPHTPLGHPPTSLTTQGYWRGTVKNPPLLRFYILSIGIDNTKKKFQLGVVRSGCLVRFQGYG